MRDAPTGNKEAGGSRRLDQALVDAGLAPSRSRARDAILRGTVTVDGKRIDKPSLNVTENAVLGIDDPAGDYVSRAALKLVAGLGAFGLDPAGRHCLDVGASTGGFTEVLLRRGAAHVTAIDVGHGQFHPRLAADPRVTSIEGLNARDLAPEHLASAPGFIVSDVSFISLTLALGPALELAAPGAALVALVKPQFEVGRENVGKGGIVRDAAIAESAVDRVAAFVGAQAGWRVIGRLPSPITGSDGNTEHLLGAIRD
ncbi:TlyA family RNA methyltransferase [Methylobrevis pamukkalensis]|uniref:16S/23S rRNA (Cytidine-2'-O)-methyltransferase TlyA n=1 Tax=Methylobrevis pamukkalensis TaxID=1439726 RepID=A0A1E3H485_9HYPH|nr:TlyA family RNA methyltransferase [Methylobrevis pamukkalensis]ODN70965.1 16S/23S rRNA (cytidine-2'-O)-methyltransferase TlyA [Methylobrevis pamukkalensis]